MLTLHQGHRRYQTSQQARHRGLIINVGQTKSAAHPLQGRLRLFLSSTVYSHGCLSCPPECTALELTIFSSRQFLNPDRRYLTTTHKGIRDRIRLIIALSSACDCVSVSLSPQPHATFCAPSFKPDALVLGFLFCASATKLVAVSMLNNWSLVLGKYFSQRHFATPG